MPKTRFFDTEHRAIQTAKQRAQSAYSSQLIYHVEEGFFIREKYSGQKRPEIKPIIEVRFDGSVRRLNQEEIAE